MVTSLCSNFAAGLYGNFLLYSSNRPFSSSSCLADFPLIRGILNRQTYHISSS